MPKIKWSILLSASILFIRSPMYLNPTSKSPIHWTPFSAAIFWINDVVTSVLMMTLSGLSRPWALYFVMAYWVRMMPISLPLKNRQLPLCLSITPIRSASGSVLMSRSASISRANGSEWSKDSTTSGLGMLKVTFSKAPLKLDVAGSRVTSKSNFLRIG